LGARRRADARRRARHGAASPAPTPGRCRARRERHAHPGVDRAVVARPRRARSRYPARRGDLDARELVRRSGCRQPVRSRPRRRGRMPYSGPVVVLCSPRTAGAAEDFVVAFRAGDRGPLIGEGTGGSTGQTAVLPVAPGWKIRLTVSRDAFPDGKEFVGTGIAPDIPVDVRVEDVLAGRAAALDP